MAARARGPYGRCERFLHDQRCQGSKQPAESPMSRASQTMLTNHEATI